MRAVQRLKGLGWLLSCVVVVLGCYMISLSVAAERNKLARVNLQIALAQRDLRALSTEFDTRSNMVQLERWNGEVLSLAAPTAGQFVRDENQFAALARSPVSAAPEVKMAALVVPAGVMPIQTANAAAVAAVAATPKPVAAVAKVAVVTEPRPALPAPARIAAVRPAERAAAPAAKRVAVAQARTEERAQDRAQERKARAVAMLDRQLLSDATLGDIVSGARRETVRRR